MSKICHQNEKQSATGLFTKGQNSVADGRTSKMPKTTSGAGQRRQIFENKSEDVLFRKWFDRWYVAESLCNGLRRKINHVLISKQHDSRRGRPIGSFSKPRRRRERHQTKGLMSKSIVMHVRFESLYISLPSSAEQQREMTKFYE